MIAPEIKSKFQNVLGVLPGVVLRRDETARQLFLADSGGCKYLPVRVIRHARVLRHETALEAKVSPRALEVLEPRDVHGAERRANLGALPRTC